MQTAVEACKMLPTQHIASQHRVKKRPVIETDERFYLLWLNIDAVAIVYYSQTKTIPFHSVPYEQLTTIRAVNKQKQQTVTKLCSLNLQLLLIYFITRITTEIMYNFRLAHHQWVNIPVLTDHRHQKAQFQPRLYHSDCCHSSDTDNTLRILTSAIKLELTTTH